MNNIRQLCENWANQTYGKALSDMKLTDSKLLSRAEYVFSELRISNIPMDGYSCENLPKTDEARVGIRKTYSEIFHEEVEKNDFSPATFLLSVMRECLVQGLDNAKTVGACARGLRTLTSLLREPDFALAIKEELISLDPDVSASLNAKQDSADHTDVLLSFNGQKYRIWLYQFSSRGLPHDIERLTGKRGTLPNGIHVICPLHTELAINYDSLRKKMHRLETNKEKKEIELASCSEKARKKMQTLRQQLENINEELSETIPLLSREKSLSDSELDIVNGWFFYSSAHIERVASYIANIKNPRKYDEVVDILSAAEKYVGSVNAFIKGE